MIVKRYQPGRVITLYDFKVNAICKGVLYINQIDETATIDEYFRFLDNFFLEKLAVLGSLVQRFSSILTTILIIFSLIFLIGVFSPILITKFQYNKDSQNQILKINPGLISLNNQNLDPVLSKQLNDFRIVIPKINLESRVFANVDTTAENLYDPSLAQGVAHAKDSYLPGEKGPIILFAHSTDSIFDIKNFNAKFFGLNNLDTGDIIEIDFEGKKYQYKVVKKETISSLNLDYLRNYNTNLFLVTCWPPGTSWQRLVISANSIT